MSGRFVEQAATEPTSGGRLEQLDMGPDAAATETPAAPRPKRKKPLAFHLSFAGLMITILVVSLDATTLAVALPVITTELKGTTLEAFWANIAFLLAMVVVQPMYASFSDAMGRVVPLHVSLLLFAVGSVVFAVARSMAVVIAGRVLQGLGAGGLDVLGEIIVTDMTTLRERPLYFGLLGLPMAAGAILGPILGAVLAEYAGWRWIGWINLPLVFVSAVLLGFFLRLRTLPQPLWVRLRSIDWLGLALFTTGCSALVLPLSWAQVMFPWSSWQTLVPLVVGAVLLVVFAVYEGKPSNPIFPHRIFASGTASSTLIQVFCHGLIVYCGLAFLPLFFQAVRLETPLQSGVSMLPLTIVSVVASVASPLLVQWMHRYCPNMWLGWVLQAVGEGLLALLSQTSSRAEMSGIQVVAALGIGALYQVLAVPMQASAPTVDDTGLAMGILVTFRLLGGLVGLAVGTTIFTSIFAESIRPLLPLAGPLEALKDANQAVGFIPVLRELDLPHEVLNPVINAYLRSLRGIWYFLAAVAVTGFVSSWFTKELSLDKEDMGRQQFVSSD